MNKEHRKYRIIRELVLHFKAQEIEPSVDEINRMWNSVGKKIVEAAKVERRRHFLRYTISVSAVVLLLALSYISIFATG